MHMFTYTNSYRTIVVNITSQRKQMQAYRTALSFRIELELHKSANVSFADSEGRKADN